MECYLLLAGIALCLFSLWAIARHDWLRLTRPTERGMGKVIGHRAGWDEGQRCYSAIYEFTDPAGRHEVIDQIYAPAPRPPLGSQVDLVWPQGRPDLARPPRPLLWALCYALLAGCAALLGAKLFGLLPG
jgi:hypothetical protein